MISSSPVSQHVGEVGEVPCCITPTVPRLQAGLINEGLVIRAIRTYGVYDGGGGLGRSVATPIKLLGASDLRKKSLEGNEGKVTQPRPNLEGGAEISTEH